MAAKSDTLVPSQSKNIHIAELLIEMVRNYLVLYDKRHPKHKDSLLKDDLWNKIGNELGLTGPAGNGADSSGARCQAKWDEASVEVAA
ncbi:hypothetical protein HPB52_000439 [Rhipicephalus sanguineus]|uniref:MADF domain-containing protein n=1 Tax=Rhipicephalus sanguineus TaxID=34632 RepID=A0A9D4PDR2_RHISA|nr:hypothetical protein HPB52_000439 [Rhipicephalus sanguineus]